MFCNDVLSKECGLARSDASASIPPQTTPEMRNEKERSGPEVMNAAEITHAYMRYTLVCANSA